MRPKPDGRSAQPTCIHCGFPSKLHIVGFCMPGAVGTHQKKVGTKKATRKNRRS